MSKESRMKETLTQTLSKGINQLSDHRLKRNAKYCPRCRKPAVSRDQRRCMDCLGNLLFPGDTASQLSGDWFMWHRSIFGFEGWYHRSFFDTTQLHVTEGFF